MMLPSVLLVGLGGCGGRVLPYVPLRLCLCVGLGEGGILPSVLVWEKGVGILPSVLVWEKGGGVLPSVLVLEKGGDSAICVGLGEGGFCHLGEGGILPSVLVWERGGGEDSAICVGLVGGGGGGGGSAICVG